MTYTVLAVIIDDDDPQAFDEVVASAVEFEEVARDVVDLETAELVAREAREGYQG